MGPAHTTNDTVVWLPDHRLLFSGDLIFNQGTPFVVMGSVAGSLEAIQRLRDLGAETIVPGHGPVCGPELFDPTEAYLRFVQKVAKEGFDAARRQYLPRIFGDQGRGVGCEAEHASHS